MYKAQMDGHQPFAQKYSKFHHYNKVVILYT